MSGVLLAFSWLTVLPLRGPHSVDRTAGGRAIRAAPLTGIALGGLAAGLLWVLVSAGLDPALAGLLTVGAHALATRGMHIDGLSDTVDGLGCYGPPERARAVMHSGGAGPFGVCALVICLGAQALAFGSLAASGQFTCVAVAVAAGRVAVVFACRHGIPASSTEGFGALVAGTQSPWTGVTWAVPLLAAAAWCTSPWWQGPVVTAVALTLTALLVTHCVRRFGGLNGDVLGATLEITVTVSAIGLAF
ncbi:adenosylcobinamide-GDP ribazoletransferase [Rhodococcus sp. WS4]|nr:adenosylcobinamide-GDP ribazoletransferase [Rhodococcus sp. WS4]